MKILLIALTYIVLFYSFFRITFLISRKVRKKDLYKMIEVYFLEQRFKIDVKKLTINNIYNIVSLSNAVILTSVLIITSFIEDLLLQLLLATIILIPIIYLVYYIISIFLKRKGF